MTIHSKKNRFWVIVSFILTFALVLVIADFGSNLITIKTFSSSTSFSGQTAYNIYAISLFSSTSKTEAISESVKQQKKSGAGFIFQHDNKFHVIASAYIEHNDALLVKENLLKENIASSIIKIEVPAITVSSTHTNQELNALVGAVTIYKIVFDNLYDISVALDTQINTETESMLFVADVDNLVSKAKLNFEAMFCEQLSTEIIYIKLSLEDLSKKTEALKKYSFSDSTTQTFSSKIKQTYMEVIAINLELCKNI